MKYVLPAVRRWVATTLLLAPFASFGSPHLAAQDPPTPPGGFAVTQLLNQVVTYSDGYRTTADLRWPARPAPAGGWPGVLVVHGKGGQRGNQIIASTATRLAQQGYLTLAYDVRGQGSTPTLNPGAPANFSVNVLVRDMADLHHITSTVLSVPFDAARFGVTGLSQGGRHSWWAAAYSGRPLPAAGFTPNFPTVSAVVPWITAGDPAEISVPQGKAFNTKFALRILLTNPTASSLLFNEQFALARTLVASGNPTSLARATTVPSMAIQAWHDEHNPVIEPIDFINSLPATTPKRLYLGTFAHGTPQNTTEIDSFTDLTRRWFDRFLKRIPNRVPNEPFADVAMMPDDPADYDDPSSHWAHRLETAWPPAHPTETLYPTAAGTLSTAAPTTAQPLGVVEHRVQSGYGMRAFLIRDFGNPTRVARNIVFDELRFDGAPLQRAKEIAGRVHIDVDAVPTGPDFQLHAALFDVPPSGAPVFVTAGTALERGVTPSGRVRLSFDLNDIAYRFAKGHRIRIQFENVAWHRPGSQSAMILVPYFTDVDVALGTRPTAAARVVLPVPADPRIDLTPAIQSLGVAAGGRAPLDLDGGLDRAGHGYIVAAGVSGIAPGRNLPPRVWLNLDRVSFTSLMLAGQSIFQNTSGFLDANGQASAALALGPGEIPAAAAGLRVHWAAASYDGASGITGVSAPVIVDLVP